MKKLSTYVRIVFFILALIWAEMICATINPNNNDAILRALAGIVPIGLVVFWSFKQRKKIKKSKRKISN